MSNQAFTGLPEDYFLISADAPHEWPVDAIDCSISRAESVIALAVLALDCKESSIQDGTLIDAIWAAQGAVTALGLLAEHYQHSVIAELSRTANSGLSAVMMLLCESSDRPANFILSDCLKMVATKLALIKGMSHQVFDKAKLDTGV